MKKPPRILVWCDRAEQDAVARLHGGQYFCACCGSTDHEEV